MLSADRNRIPYNGWVLEPINPESLLLDFDCGNDDLNSLYKEGEIARSVDMGRGAVQRELENLVDAGLVLRRKQGNQVHYQASPQASIFQELKSLMFKTGRNHRLTSRSAASLGRTDKNRGHLWFVCKGNGKSR